MAAAAINPPLPLGYRFKPTDQELVGFFLYKLLVLKQPLIPLYDKKIILEYNLYGSKLEPWEIWTDFGGDGQVGDQCLYFFCPLKKLHANSSRIDRKIGRGGTWSEGPPSTLVEDSDHYSKPIGLKRKLRYENQDSEQDGKWFLDEYSLFRCDRCEDEKGYDFDSVICRLRKNERLSGEKRKCSSSSKASSKKKPANKKLKKDQLPISNSCVVNNIVVEEPQTQSSPSSDLVVVSGFEKDYQIVDKNYDHHENQLVSTNYWPDENILMRVNAASDNTDHEDYVLDPMMSLNIDELLAEIDREYSPLPPLPQIVDQTPESWPISQVYANGVLEEASSLTLIENTVESWTTSQYIT